MYTSPTSSTSGLYHEHRRVISSPTVHHAPDVLFTQHRYHVWSGNLSSSTKSEQQFGCGITVCERKTHTSTGSSALSSSTTSATHVK